MLSKKTMFLFILEINIKLNSKCSDSFSTGFPPPRAADAHHNNVGARMILIVIKITSGFKDLNMESLGALLKKPFLYLQYCTGDFTN